MPAAPVPASDKVTDNRVTSNVLDLLIARGRPRNAKIIEMRKYSNMKKKKCEGSVV